MIIFNDKTHYDEQIAEVVSNYIDLAKKLKNLPERNGASEKEIKQNLVWLTFDLLRIFPRVGDCFVECSFGSRLSIIK